MGEGDSSPFVNLEHVGNFGCPLQNFKIIMQISHSSELQRYHENNAQNFRPPRNQENYTLIKSTLQMQFKNIIFIEFEALYQTFWAFY